jgi:DNA polymerase III delta prime subunit
MPQARKKPEAPARPARRTKSPHEPKRQVGDAPAQAEKSKQPAKSKRISEQELVRLAHYFFAYHEWMIYLAQSVDRPSPLRVRFDEHLGADASELPILSETFESYDQVNVQRAIDRYLAPRGRTHDLVGVAEGRRMSLSDLVASKQRSGLQTGPVERVNLPSGPESVEACVQVGLYFITDHGKPSILFVRGPDLTCGRSDYILDVVSADAASGSALLGEIRDAIAQSNVFRGRVISFADTNIGRLGLGPMVFWQRPDISSERLVLPDGLLEVIERQVFGIAEHRDRLRRGGHHLKRGLLLHGPPGTGKTHTVRYLLGKAKDHTVIVLTGGAMRFVRQACALARLLQPAIVVLEDVDLVAKHRDYEESGNPLLFDVLNQLDGIADDADIVFVLTTNRADLLEPALAARPGRVDLAVEIPLPADEERRRLLHLYGKGMKVGAATEEEVVRRTSGVTASFLRELVRKAALLAAVAGSANGKIVVKDAHLMNALQELLAERSALTRVLLGEQGRRERDSYVGSGWL